LVLDSFFPLYPTTLSSLGYSVPLLPRSCPAGVPQFLRFTKTFFYRRAFSACLFSLESPTSRTVYCSEYPTVSAIHLVFSADQDFSLSFLSFSPTARTEKGKAHMFKGWPRRQPFFSAPLFDTYIRRVSFSFLSLSKFADSRPRLLGLFFLHSRFLVVCG